MLLLKHRSLELGKPSFTDKAFEAPEINRFAKGHSANYW